MKHEDTVMVNKIPFKYDAFYQRLNSDHPKFNIACPKCFGLYFSLSYKEYECIAHCSCGHSMTIYDG